MYGAVFYHMYDVIMTYRRRDVNVVVSKTHARELVFPAVTLCNMSPVKKSAWKEYVRTVNETKTAENNRKKRKKRSAAAGKFRDMKS